MLSQDRIEMRKTAEENQSYRHTGYRKEVEMAVGTWAGHIAQQTDNLRGGKVFEW